MSLCTIVSLRRRTGSRCMYWYSIISHIRHTHRVTMCIYECIYLRNCLTHRTRTRRRLESWCRNGSLSLLLLISWCHVHEAVSSTLQPQARYGQCTRLDIDCYGKADSLNIYIYIYIYIYICVCVYFFYWAPEAQYHSSWNPPRKTKAPEEPQCATASPWVPPDTRVPPDTDLISRLRTP